MDRPKTKQAGFSIAEALLAVVVIVLLAGAGWAVYQHVKATGAASNSTQSATQQKSMTTTQTNADPYAGWRTFIDNASASSSGIMIKYPSDWQVNTAGTKTYAWSISDSQDGITVSYVFQNNSKTAQQEWEACYATDACSGGPDTKLLSGSESNINGLDAYSAIMQNSNGTYHVTVIRGLTATANGVPFVVFTTYSTDQTALSVYSKIVASATFPS